MIECAQIPSFVSNNRPSVSLSRRPTGNTPIFLNSGGNKSITTGCVGSSTAVIYPAGL